MHLLATSTAEHRNKVRILFYGQSITEQDWWHQVVANLRTRFPHADLEVENRAIGGFPSQRLILPAEHDIFAFYPDLIIFHVYGADRPYEDIIRSIRSRTTAEVLIQTDHITKIPPATISKWRDAGSWWDDRMNNNILPRIARKYGCGLVDVHNDWLRYLKTNHLEPSALLLDGVHLNSAGCDLMARLIERYLVVQPNSDESAWGSVVKQSTVVTKKQDLTEVGEAGSDVAFDRGRLAMQFDGNRVDLILASEAADPPTRTLEVRIDGKKPSEWPELYAITRPEPKPWSPIALIRVNHEAPLLAEEWTLTIDSYSAEPPAWSFHVVGSKTGADGSGTNGVAFVSNSKRVMINPDFWFAEKPVKPGYEIHWSVRPQFVDVYTPKPSSDPTLEAVSMLVQGLPNGPHTLELLAGPDGLPTIESIRVYKPPFTPMNPLVVRSLIGAGVLFGAIALWWGSRRFVFPQLAKLRRLRTKPATV